MIVECMEDEETEGGGGGGRGGDGVGEPTVIPKAILDLHEGNILYCQGVLPDDILSQLVLDGLVNCQIILSLQNSPVDELTIRKTSTLLNQLPQQWLTTDNKSVESIKRYLYYLQDTLQRMLMSSTNEKIKKDTRKMEDTVLELRTLLLSS